MLAAFRNSIVGGLMLGFCVVLMAAGGAWSQDATVADRLAEALDLYNDLEFDAGLKIADELLVRPALTSHDSVAIYEVLSIITYAKGEAYLQASLGYLNRISTIGPCMMPMPRDIWPRELRDRWYQFLKEKDQLTCDKPSADIHTIAIMPFDNFFGFNLNVSIYSCCYSRKSLIIINIACQMGSIKWEFVSSLGNTF